MWGVTDLGRVITILMIMFKYLVEGVYLISLLDDDDNVIDDNDDDDDD